MSLPTSGEIASFTLLLRLTGIKDVVVRARPDLAELAAVAEHGPLALTIELPPTPSGYHNRVVLGRNRGHWILVGSRSFDLLTYAWELDTADEQLRDAVIATYDACLAKSEVDSPWRWAEGSRSTIVRVADGLIDEGFDVDGVVSSNRLMNDEIEGADKPRLVSRDFGDALRIKMPWGTGTLARKPTLGWVFDANDYLVTRRLSIADSAADDRFWSPGLKTEDASILIRAVARTVREGRWNPGAGEPLNEIEFLDRSLDAAGRWWLRELGLLGGLRAGWDRHEERVPFHVVTTRKRCGLGAVKAAFADAAVAQTALVVFATDGYTRDAVRWADKAGSPLFWIDSDSYAICPASARASELTPRVI